MFRDTVQHRRIVLTNFTLQLKSLFESVGKSINLNTSEAVGRVLVNTQWPLVIFKPVKIRSCRKGKRFK